MNNTILASIQLYLDLSGFRPGYFCQLVQNIIASFIPLHLFVFGQQFRFLDVFEVFHGWVPYLEYPRQRVSFRMSVL